MSEPLRLSRRDALPLLASSPLWLPHALKGQTAPLKRYPHATGYLRELIADDQFPGSVLMIHREGQPDFVDVAGWLDGARQTPMIRDGIFFLASLSKPITAVATLILIEQGKLKLDDAIEKWLPELANRQVLNTPGGPLDQTHPSPRPITVGDLLAFRCGYGGDGPRGPFGAAQRVANTSPDRAATLEPAEFLKELNPIPLQYAPGKQWLYDVPADILSVLIARVSGKRHGEFLKEHILGPLGMKDTGFWVPPTKVARIAQYPVGIHADTAPKIDPKFESGAHGMVSTADDYMRFTRMLLNRGELDKVRILKASSVDAMRIDRLSPEEHKAGGFIERYPGRGFGWCGAVRTEALEYGPSVGSYNWSGGSGVWMMVDYARKMAITIMVQHPTGGGPPGPEQPIGREALPTPAAPKKKYLAQTVWNDLMQTEIYKDVT